MMKVASSLILQRFICTPASPYRSARWWRPWLGSEAVWANTSRRSGSSLLLSIWCTRTCLSKQSKLSILTFVKRSKGIVLYLCKLSGLGYLCCWTLLGQNGHTYPGESWASPCLIMSLFPLNPLPASDRGHPGTGQKYGRVLG